MKLSVSNIAWGKENFLDFLKLLKEEGCEGVELAPSLIWDEPILSSNKERLILKKQISDSGLKLVGFHSLLFSRPDLQLFKNEISRRNTIIYLKELIKLCSELDGTQLVFGSPNNRLLHGKKYEDCLSQSYDDFLNIAEYCFKNRVYFCIEPLGKNLSEFIVSMNEGGDLVRKINHPNFRLHLDTKTVFTTKEDMSMFVENYGDLIQHVHVSDDDLNEPGSVNKNEEHINLSQYLKKIKYENFLSIEMKKNGINALKRGIKFVKSTYISADETF